MRVLHLRPTEVNGGNDRLVPRSDLDRDLLDRDPGPAVESKSQDAMALRSVFFDKWAV